MRRQALAEDREPELRLRRRAGADPADPAAPREAAALKRLLLAVLVALLGTAAGYLLLGAVLALASGWSGKVVLDQAVGLAVHAGVVFARGVLPAVLVTSALGALARRRAGRDPGPLATLALSLLVAAPVGLWALTTSIGGWPRLEVQTVPNALATLALLAAVSGGADLLARRWLGGRAS